MSVGPGVRLGAYEIIALIGAGGMGEVYRAHDTRLKRDVAIKILPAEFANDAERLARFQREAEVVASLNHPNIAQIHGLEETDHSRALVLELVEGETLGERITRGAIPLNEAVPIARQIAEALEAAHERGIIHRDLKPANIKITPDGTVKVLDFGLAKLADSAASGSGIQTAGLSHSPTMTSPALVTGGGVLLGTAAYMSPEQAAGRPVDPRSDLWSFGVVLMEMLTGRQVFEGETVSHVLASILKSEPDWARLPAGTPAAICRLLRRCLEKDRRNRLASASDARLELQEALAPAASGAQAVVNPVEPRSRRIAMLAVGALFLGALALGGALWIRAGMMPAPPAPRRFGVAAARPVDVPGGGNIAISPDGSTIAYIVDGRLNVRRLDRLEPTVFSELGTVRQPFFSPDSRTVAFFTAGTGGDLMKIAADGGPAVTITSLAASPRGGTWLPDGRIVFATADWAAGLLAVNSAGGKPVTLKMPTTPNLRYAWPSAIAGSRALFFAMLGDSTAQVGVLNLETNEEKMLVAGSSPRFSPTGHLVYAFGPTVFAAPFDLDRLDLIGEGTPVQQQVQTTTGTGGSTYFDLSFTGSFLYVPEDAEHILRTFAWVDRSGKQDSIGLPPKRYDIPRISPDGTRLAIHVEDSNNGDIFVYDLSTNSEMRLTFDTAQDIRPLWSRDSRWIYFRSDVKGAGIYRKASDGTGTVEPVVPVTGDGAPNSISPDGRWLIYSNVVSVTGRDLWITSVDGTSKPKPLIVEPGNQGNVVVSPNGRWVAYQDESYGYIYVRPFPNVSEGRWQVSAENSKWPVWSHDGRELFFVSGPDSARGIMSVAVQTDQDTFKYSSPTMVVRDLDTNFSGRTGSRNYDLSPDGKRFLIINEQTPRAGSPLLVIVDNWFEELKRLVPAK